MSEQRLPRPPKYPVLSRRLARPFFGLCVLWALTACGSAHTSLPATPQKLTYEILETHPHDPRIFTQGLVIDGDVITETSGLYAKSFLLQYHAESGEIVQRIDLPRNIFAEGITKFEDRFYMLTWHAEKAFVFDAETLDQETVLEYSGEGWGITHDGRELITSNGSDTLSFRNPTDFAVVKTLQVKDAKGSWNQLNELEYAEGHIWANVWQTPLILAISPESGQVEGVLDLAELDRINNHSPGQSVLNGIAYDPARHAFWITGKWWPNRYLIRLQWPDTRT